MNNSTRNQENSCKINEKFDQDNITPFGGVSIILDMLNHLSIRSRFEKMSIQKAPWATFSLARSLLVLIIGYMLGMQRILHIKILEEDPILCRLLGLSKLPSFKNLYRDLDRFDCPEKVDNLCAVNASILHYQLNEEEPIILDIDTTVETVYGSQEASSVGYNPKNHGKASYQPIFAFDGRTKAVLHAELRNGNAPDAAGKIKFYQETKRNLPEGVKIGYVRADKAFPSKDFLEMLESDQVGYTLKLSLTDPVKKRIQRGVLWKRIHFDDTFIIEVGSVGLKLSVWGKYRRVVVIRTSQYC